jgi:3-hydroxyacyl-CoA dehydrogenase
MKLVEIVPSDEVLPAVLDSIVDLCDWHLGKSIVTVKDTPNFIANRVGTFAIQTVFDLMQESGLGIEEIDLLTGPVLGRPKSATFRTLDIIGLDTYAHVILNIYENAKDDEHREIFKIPSLVESLIRKNWLGDKTRQGFYKRLKTQEILTLDPQTLEYLPRQEVKLPSLATAQAIPTIEDRLSFLVNCPDQVGKFVWRFLSRIMVYAANRIPEVSDSIVDIDNALKWGFNWELGPFETWDALGPETVCQRVRRDGGVVPLWAEQLLATPEKRFYAKRDGQRFHYVSSTRSYAAVPEPHGVLFLSSLKDRGKVMRKVNSGSLLDLGDGIACLEFHSKMNTIDDELLRMIEETLEMIGGSFLGLLIANEGQHFCAGANLKLILKNAQEKKWQAIDDMIRTFQRVNMNIKYSSRPVVVAPFGMTLGGGCEIALHSCSLQAAAETYMGLVELGVGLIPAAGGTKEMLLRTLEKIAGCPSGDFSAHLRQTFETIATGKVSSSASEARKLAFLRETDGVTMNRDRLLADGKHRILGLLRQGFVKPLPPKGVIAYGKRALALLKLGIHLARKAEQISDYDALLATKLAFVLCGGDCNNLQEVSEAYILDLEREVFLSLCGQERTQARIEHMLETGKPLRN